MCVSDLCISECEASDGEETFPEWDDDVLWNLEKDIRWPRRNVHQLDYLQIEILLLLKQDTVLIIIVVVIIIIGFIQRPNKGQDDAKNKTKDKIKAKAKNKAKAMTKAKVKIKAKAMIKARAKIKGWDEAEDKDQRLTVVALILDQKRRLESGD